MDFFLETFDLVTQLCHLNGHGRAQKRGIAENQLYNRNNRGGSALILA